MADGIEINSNFNIGEGLADVDLQNVFFSGSVGDVLAKFGQKLIGDLRDSIDNKGLNATGALNQSMSFELEVNGNTFEFSFSMADYYKYLDKGVNGSQTAYATPYSFRNSGKDWQKKKESLMTWIGAKAVFGGLQFEEREGLAFGIMRKQQKFGMKPTQFYSSVVGDGRMEQLQEDLQNAAAEDISGLFISI